MAAAASHYPRSSGTGDASAALNSPQSKRGAAARGVLSPPWTQVVQGAESEPEWIAASSSASPSSPSAAAAAVAASTSSSLSFPEDSAAEGQPESTDNGGAAGSSNAGKKPVWNKPSNSAVEVGAVMGAVSWPALSESTRASPKPSSSDSLKTLSDGSGTGIGCSSQKQVIANDANPSFAPNHVVPSIQKSMKPSVGSSSGIVTTDGRILQPVPPLGLAVDMPPDNAGKPGSSVPETSSRDQTHKGSGQRGGFGSQSHSGNDSSQQRTYRRGNGYSHPRSDGSYHQNNGGKRDHDRGNHDRHSHRSFNGRDTHMQPQRGVHRGFIRPLPHSSTPFLPPPPMPVRPFGNPMVYPEALSPMFYVQAPPPPPDSLRGVPIVTPILPHGMFFPVPDPLLHAKITSQINYYFSNENLISDAYLRQNMDEDGWVPIELIAGFKKVMMLTNNIPLILDALRSSEIVEVQNGKVRKRNDWRRWIMPPSVEFGTVSSPRSVERSSHETHDTLTTNIQNMSLEEKTHKQGQADAFLRSSSSGDLNTQSQLYSADGTGQTAAQVGSGRSILARSSSK